MLVTRSANFKTINIDIFKIKKKNAVLKTTFLVPKSNSETTLIELGVGIAT